MTAPTVTRSADPVLRCTADTPVMTRNLSAAVAGHAAIDAIDHILAAQRLILGTPTPQQLGEVDAALVMANLRLDAIVRAAREITCPGVGIDGVMCVNDSVDGDLCADCVEADRMGLLDGAA